MAENKRQVARSKVLYGGTIRCEGRSFPIRILDLSCNGALISGVGLPLNEGSLVTLTCGKQSVEAAVCWVRANEAGLSLHAELRGQVFSRPKSMIARSYEPDPNWRRPAFRGDQLTDDEKWFIEQLRSEGALPQLAAGQG